jgi:ATP-dependent DNA ligase
MAEKYMKAVEWDKLSAAFKKTHSQKLAASYGMWLQRKYDGCYGEAVMSDSGDRMLSREGLDYTKSCAHILRRLRSVGFENGSVIGEVYAFNTPFPEVSGRFRRQSQGEQDVVFIMHDLKDQRPYSERLSELDVYEARQWDTEQRLLFVADTYKVGEWDGDPLEWAIKWKAEGGYDGAILRDPKAPYTTGLVKNGEVVKVKPVLSLDLQCAGLFTAEGEKTGRDVYTIGVCYRGVLTMVGSGVPHRKNFCPQPGQIVQIDCMGLTEDGKLREPRFIAIRHDKTQPDT